jgi:hypothetical protein
MAKILENEFQKPIEEEGKMEDNKPKEAPAIDSVIATGADFIQLPKLGENKDAATDEGANAVKATSPEFNPNKKSSENDAVTDAAALEAKARAPYSIPTDPTTNDNGISESLGEVSEPASPDKMEESEAKATAPDSIPTDTATNDNGISASQGEVPEPASLDKMVEDLKQKISQRDKSTNAPREVSVEPSMVSLSRLCPLRH